MWSRDAYGIPSRTNLYGNHPFYVDQRVGSKASASGTFLLNSHGMDITFPGGGSNIEFNALGGIADLFFFNGPTPGEVAKQGAQVWGASKEVPYWSLGYHSCRYGYEDIYQVAEVIANVSQESPYSILTCQQYSAAGIPMQTQWLDIDYMANRWVWHPPPSATFG